MEYHLIVQESKKLFGVTLRWSWNNIQVQEEEALVPRNWGIYQILKVLSVNLSLEFVVGMDRSLNHNVEDEEKPKVKVNPIQPLDEDPTISFFIIPKRVMYLENIGIHLKSEFETIGEARISNEFDHVYNQNMSFKTSYECLE